MKTFEAHASVVAQEGEDTLMAGGGREVHVMVVPFVLCFVMSLAAGRRKGSLGGMNPYLGIDGGGTHTRAVLVTGDGRVVGAGEAGPCNYHNVGLETAGANLRAAAEAAWAAAGLRFQAAPAAFIGSAGMKAAVDLARLTSAAENAGLAPAGEITVANDIHNALAGGLAGRAGVALIAGTGSNCLGRDASGATFMCGGWGWLIDDDGSGTGLALAAMRAVVRAVDGRAPATRLTQALLAFWGLSEPDELSERLYVRPWTPDQLAGFTPVVCRLAEEGDSVAREVLLSGAKALAQLVKGATAALDFPKGPEVVVLGGCARSGAPYQPLVEAAIRAAVHDVRLVEPVYSPLHGAALNVLRVAGQPTLKTLRFPKP